MQTLDRSLSMPGITMSQDVKDVVRKLIDAGEIEAARQIILDLINAAIEADTLHGRGDGQPVGLLASGEV